MQDPRLRDKATFLEHFWFVVQEADRVIEDLRW